MEDGKEEIFKTIKAKIKEKKIEKSNYQETFTLAHYIKDKNDEK